MGASEDEREGGLFQGIKVNSKSPGLHNIAQCNGVPHTVSHTQIVITLLQRDQIGRLLKFLALAFIKMYLEICLGFKLKTVEATFLATFGDIGLHFYSTIWSHCSQ